ncbi:MAG: TIGR02300 family protein [Rhodospirillaceae bacterium]|nr:MAG: TIGR02300 family protein [Rhodospirillaceae bacterium]
MGTFDKGHKHTCSKCAARFFDLLKDTATCPKCGTVDQTETGRLAAIAALEAEANTEARTEAPESEEKDSTEQLLDLDVDDDENDEGDEEDSLMEDTSDLSHVEDDVTEVLGHMESPGPTDL